MWIAMGEDGQPPCFRMAAMMAIILMQSTISAAIAAETAPQSLDTSVLRSFEKSAIPKPEIQSETRYRAPSHTSRQENGIGDELAQDFMDMTMNLMIAGGYYSMQRVASEANDPMRRIAGEPLIPFMRYDFAYQHVSSRIGANIHRFESGYGPVALLLEKYTFNEHEPSNTLQVERQMFMYRMSVGNDAEIDLGIGKSVITGMQRTTINVISLPVKFMIGEMTSVELRPTWGGAVDDFEVALHWGVKLGSLKAGYRILSSPDASLKGPFAGMAFYY